MSMSLHFRALIVAARLAALVAILSVHLTASGGGDAVAAPFSPYPDFWSVDAFKRDCTGSGGSIEITEGSIACFHDDGSAIVCDENAKNCSSFPPSGKEQTTPGPYSGADEVANGPFEELDPTSPIEPATGDGVTNVQAGTNANAVRVWTFACPAGTDPNGEMTWDQLTAVCTTKPIPPFPISVSVESVPYGIMESDYTGILTEYGLPPGTITLHVEASYPYKKPAAFCWAHLDGQFDRPMNRYQVTDAWSMSIHDLLPNQFVGCSWFYINPSPGYVYVKTYECPAGINITNVSASQLKQACPVSRTPVEFILTHETGGVSHEYTSVYSDVAFKYLDAGDVTIREGVPPGFGVPIVYCDTTRATAGGLVTVRQYQRQIMASPDSIRANIETVGDAISCDWFNVPGTLPAGSDQEPPRDLPADSATPPDAMPTETPTATPPPTATVTPTDEPVIEPTFEPTDAGPWTVPEGTIPVFEPVEPTPTPVILT